MTPSPETPASQLLSEPRLAEIEIIGSVMRGPFADDYDARAGQAIMDLLADRTAYQAQVRTELRRMLYPTTGYESSPAGYLYMQQCMAANKATQELAARLHLGEL